ncbi:hypothetical protein Vretimale_17421 [Volvox reticuliferus]|uniref:Uncharacterized protein n=1 Tax=Volvox reticuliferus TaxID=1737510 RepID=A0A8J4CFX6_9CHLO|nr:hypothetical protein Vretifemale_9422 [Volvox reticuliferus]GIM14496.1 hypothetical protein Vretimale_17421 [Volvox reticuliferus]
MADLSFFRWRLQTIDKEGKDKEKKLKRTLKKLEKNPGDTILLAERNRLVEALADLEARRKHLEDSLGMMSAAGAAGPQANVDGTGMAGVATARTVVSISGIDSQTWKGLSAAFGLPITASSKAPLAPAHVHETQPFSWLPQTEADPINRKAVVRYLNCMVPPPAGQEWYDSTAKRNMLSCNLPTAGIELKGTSDVALCTSAAVKGNLPELGLRIVVELKKEKSKFNPYQLATELVAANVWSPDFKPIAVMTDLMDAWQLMWATEEIIQMYTCEGRAEAIGILRAFLEQEHLTPDSTDIMHQQDNEGAEAAAGGLLKRPRLLSASGARADVADLDDLLDFGDGLGLSDADLHQLRCYKHLVALLQLAAPKLRAESQDG